MGVQNIINTKTKIQHNQRQARTTQTNAEAITSHNERIGMIWRVIEYIDKKRYMRDTKMGNGGQCTSYRKKGKGRTCQIKRREKGRRKREAKEHLGSL